MQQSQTASQIADEEERRRVKRAKKLQKTLGISFEEALKVDAITVNKGLQSKTKIDEDELKFSQGYYKILEDSQPFIRSLDSKKRVRIPRDDHLEIL